jgi:putative transposase
MTRQPWINEMDDMAITRQCLLAGVSRSTFYARQHPNPVDESDILISRLIDEEYTRHPFYGTRRMVVFLKTVGHTVNRKRVQRLMRAMGLAGMAPGPNTSLPHPEHKVYPYLLRGVPVIRPNQVWSTDITYIRLAHGFAYLVAIMDWYSRRVLSWRISNTMEAVFCVDCLEEAIRRHGKPEIFNSDQGSQFTSDAFTGVLISEGVTISMDGRGRAFDNIFVERLWRNVKYEDVYLKGYATMGELQAGLTEYFLLYNGERPHQSLGNKTPDVVYQTGIGGGAMIVDKFPRAEGEPSVPRRSTEGSPSAEATPEAKPKATATSKTTAKSKASVNNKPTTGQRRPAANVVESATSLN